MYNGPGWAARHDSRQAGLRAVKRANRTGGTAHHVASKPRNLIMAPKALTRGHQPVILSPFSHTSSLELLLKGGLKVLGTKLTVRQPLVIIAALDYAKVHLNITERKFRSTGVIMAHNLLTRGNLDAENATSDCTKRIFPGVVCIMSRFDRNSEMWKPKSRPRRDFTRGSAWRMSEFLK